MTSQSAAPMPMRRSRRDKQEDTRTRLIEAATRMIAEQGVAAVSIRGVCGVAGFSQGAFYPNFETLGDLLLAVLQAHVQTEAVRLRTLALREKSKSLDHTLQQLTRALAALAADTQWSLLSIELRLHAQRDAAFARRYEACRGVGHLEFELLLSDLVERYALRPLLPPAQMAAALYALWCGCVVEGAGSPDLSREQILLTFFKAVAGVPADHAAAAGRGKGTSKSKV